MAQDGLRQRRGAEPFATIHFSDDGGQLQNMVRLWRRIGSLITHKTCAGARSRYGGDDHPRLVCYKPKQLQQGAKKPGLDRAWAPIALRLILGRGRQDWGGGCAEGALEGDWPRWDGGHQGQHDQGQPCRPQPEKCDCHHQSPQANTRCTARIFAPGFSSLAWLMACSLLAAITETGPSLVWTLKAVGGGVFQLNMTAVADPTMMRAALGMMASHVTTRNNPAMG